MKSMKFLLATFTLIFSLCFASCSLFTPERGSFYGGKILDNEAMDELRKEFDESSSNNDQIESGSTIGTQILTESVQNNENTQAESENTQSESENTEKSETVFWSKSGSVWHLYIDCGYLKNSDEIYSGTVDEAIASGVKKVCSSCEKKAEN